MEFCPRCGTRLEPKKSKICEEISIIHVCPKCGHTKQENHKSDAAKTGKLIRHNAQEAVTIIGKEDQELNTLPTLRMECPKCGNNLVYVWQVQTRGGDESSTQFMRCTKCNHTFREYT